jgi:hypothetical protein
VDETVVPFVPKRASAMTSVGVDSSTGTRRRGDLWKIPGEAVEGFRQGSFRRRRWWRRKRRREAQEGLDLPLARAGVGPVRGPRGGGQGTGETAWRAATNPQESRLSPVLFPVACEGWFTMAYRDGQGSREGLRSTRKGGRLREELD